MQQEAAVGGRTVLRLWDDLTSLHRVFAKLSSVTEFSSESILKWASVRVLCHLIMATELSANQPSVFICYFWPHFFLSSTCSWGPDQQAAAADANAEKSCLTSTSCCRWLNWLKVTPPSSSLTNPPGCCPHWKLVLEVEANQNGGSSVAMQVQRTEPFHQDCKDSGRLKTSALIKADYLHQFVTGHMFSSACVSTRERPGGRALEAECFPPEKKE